MPNPTTGLVFGATDPHVPAAPTGDQNATFQGNMFGPMLYLSVYPRRATASLYGTIALNAIQQESLVYSVDSGTANAYAVTLSPAPTIVAGSEIVFIALHANTGASTVTVNGTSYPLTKNGTVALTGGEIAALQIITGKCDGTNFQIYATPATAGISLTTTGTSGAATLVSGVLNVPNYSSGGGGGGGSGLFSGNLGTLPTQSGTGFTTAFNQSANFTAVNSPIGFTIADSVGITGDLIEGKTSAYPGSPYTLTACVSLGFVAGGGAMVGFMIAASTSGVIEFFGMRGNGGTWQTAIMKWNTFNSFNGYTGSTGPNGVFTVPFIWMRLQDDGTNLKFSFSFDGQSWNLYYSTTKAASFVVGNFNLLGFVINPSGSATLGATIMSYGITFP
jgi:hypothetical protein